MKTTVFLTLIFGLLLWQCASPKKPSQSNQKTKAAAAVTAFDPENDILVRRDVNSGEYKIAIPEAVLIQSLKLADFALAEVEKVFVQPSDESHVYLVFHAQDTSGNSVKKALYLRQLSKGIFKVEDSEHTKETISHVCEGECCVDCDFKIKGNKLNGCNCKTQCAATIEDTPGYCNHSIGSKAIMILAPL